VARQGWAISAAESVFLGQSGVLLIDLREAKSVKHGEIPRTLHAPDTDVLA
jgi:hypothetical protein